MLNKLITIFIFSSLLLAKLPRYNVDELILYRANVINVTYVEPVLERSNVVAQERSFLIKLQILLTEVELSIHPDWRAKEILIIAEAYVAMNKAHQKELNILKESLKPYYQHK